MQFKSHIFEESCEDGKRKVLFQGTDGTQLFHFWYNLSLKQTDDIYNRAKVKHVAMFEFITVGAEKIPDRAFLLFIIAYIRIRILTMPQGVRSAFQSVILFHGSASGDLSGYQNG